MSAEISQLGAVRIEYHHYTITLIERHFDRITKSLVGYFAHPEFIHHQLDEVSLVPVEFKSRNKLTDLIVDPHIQKSFPS